MTHGHDTIAPLLAFHANGTLTEEERARVESHVAECAACREELSLARLARDVMRDGSVDLAGHVQAQLLAEFADGPGRLDPEIRDRVAAHLGSCDACSSLLPALRGTRPGAQRGGAGLWRLLRATVLHPIPALAYLAILAVVAVWGIRPRPVPSTPALTLLPGSIDVYGDLTLRGAPGAAAPQRIAVDPSGTIRLALHTDLEPEDTAPGAPPMRLTISREGSLLQALEVRGETIPPDGVIELVIRAERLPRDVPLNLDLRAQDPDRPSVFQKRILLATDDALPPSERL